MNDFKVGHGYDVHKLEKGRKFVIGGIEIISQMTFTQEFGLPGCCG